MELRSFLSGMLFLFGVNAILPFFGIAITVATPTPLLNLVFGVMAIALSYFLLRNG
ncbi:MAG: hypothetical protein WC588_03445 [Candidatus Micrarchaeia archaeon]